MMMVMDFDNYLISSTSPPDFNYIHSNYLLHLKSITAYTEHGEADRGANGDDSNVSKDDEDTKKQEADRVERRWEIATDRRLASSSKMKSSDVQRISDWIGAYTCDGDACKCFSSSSRPVGACKKKKAVMFADDFGLNLADVRVMREPSHEPPVLKPELTRNPADTYRETGGREIVPNFAQPAADYVAFREKLEKTGVSLENAIVREDSAIFGTIKVDNRPTKKTVFVRSTFDGWRSFRDHRAVYSNSNNSSFDTFAFEIEIPFVDGGGDVASDDKFAEFAVCFAASDGKEFWDNNDSRNYEFVRSDRSSNGEKNATFQSVFNYYRHDSSWTDFSGTDFSGTGFSGTDFSGSGFSVWSDGVEGGGDQGPGSPYW